MPNAKIVPIVIGEPSPENCQSLSDALVKVLAEKRALIIASSDLSHYPGYEDSVRVDGAVLTAITSLDPQQVRRVIDEQMSKGIANLDTCACGEGPILVAMMAAKALGANRATVLKYANSGDTPFGDRDQVVGYGAVMFWHGEGSEPTPLPTPPAHASPPSNPGQPIALTANEKTELLRMARQTIAQYLRDGTTPAYNVTAPNLLQPSGAFVTLRKHGELRGCIGSLTPRLSLYLTVQGMAVAAATEDPRFQPLTSDELKDVSIEISVLSPLRPISDVNEIEVGKHGVIIIKGQNQGVFLPQVATEEGWNREELLQNLCRKAGLPPDAWQSGAQFYVFTAEVFGE
jgi:AmmeMemoRadiSam system protein A